MSFRRRADKPDAPTQQIVDELRALGFTVCYDRASDLSVHHSTWGVNVWRKLEVKPALKSGKPKVRKDQEKQAEFLRAMGIPCVSTTEQALEYFGIKRSAA